MSGNSLKWIYLFLLSLVWGSSFILIKKGLVGLSALQVGSLRIVFAAVFLLLIGYRSLFKIKKTQWKWIAFSGFFGSFFPAYLFSFAETEIDSAIVSILNSTTPLLSMLLGIFLFQSKFIKGKMLGIMVGLFGTGILILNGASVNPDQNYWYSLLVILASLFYGMNANVIKKHLQTIPALAITTGNFTVIALPALMVLFSTDFFSEATLTAPDVPLSLFYVGILGVIGTGAALIFFNKLIQISDPVFATSVTYIVPIVALCWGFVDGETITVVQIIAGMVILLGVTLVNRSK